MTLQFQEPGIDPVMSSRCRARGHRASAGHDEQAAEPRGRPYRIPLVAAHAVVARACLSRRLHRRPPAHPDRHQGDTTFSFACVYVVILCSFL